MASISTESPPVQLSTSPAPNTCASCVELLDPEHIEKQQIIESWYSPCHFLRSIPETIMVDVVFAFLIANDFHSLVLTSFIKQFAILHGGNNVDEYMKDLLATMKVNNIKYLLCSHRKQYPGCSPLSVASEKGYIGYFKKFANYARDSKWFFYGLTSPGKNTTNGKNYSAFMEAIYYGHMEIVKYLLKVDEEVNGTSKLLFHRDTRYNLLHAAVAGCKTENGLQLLHFLLHYAMENNASVLLKEVVKDTVGTIVDLAYTHFAISFGTTCEPGSEMWYRVKVVLLLNSHPCTIRHKKTSTIHRVFNDTFGRHG